MTPDGRARVEVAPKGNANDNEEMRQFARAVLAVEPNAVEGPISILDAGDTIVRAFIEAGLWALLSIGILLWLVLRRIGDVLLTLIPLMTAGVVTLEICVLIGLPLNFANIIALPLLLGVGVAFKIYYIMAWREGQTNLLADEPYSRRVFQRTDHGDRVRQPVVLQPPRNGQHGQTVGAVADVHAGGGRVVPAGADGQAARRLSRGPSQRRRARQRSRPTNRNQTATNEQMRSWVRGTPAACDARGHKSKENRQ